MHPSGIRCRHPPRPWPPIRGSPNFREYDAADFKKELERYFGEVEILGQGFSANFRKYIHNPSARGIEWFLMQLNIKHRIPVAWRAAVRGWITGVRAVDSTPEEFGVNGQDTEQSMYLVAIARGKR